MRISDWSSDVCGDCCRQRQGSQAGAPHVDPRERTAADRAAGGPHVMASTAYSLQRLPQVTARTGLSKSEIYRRIAARPPTFPAPIKLGERASAWHSEIGRAHV